MNLDVLFFLKVKKKKTPRKCAKRGGRVGWSVRRRALKRVPSKEEKKNNKWSGVRRKKEEEKSCCCLNTSCCSEMRKISIGSVNWHLENNERNLLRAYESLSALHVCLHMPPRHRLASRCERRTPCFLENWARSVTFLIWGKRSCSCRINKPFFSPIFYLILCS